MGCSSGWGGSNAGDNLQFPRASLTWPQGSWPISPAKPGLAPPLPGTSGDKRRLRCGSLAAQHERCHAISHYIVLYCSLCHRNNLSRFSHLGLQKNLSGS